MFKKIRNKLKGVFEKHEEVVEENPDEIVEESIEEQPKEEKKSFFKKSFSKKDSEEKEEVEELQDEMLEEAPEQEKEAIKEHKELSKKEVKDNKKRVEEQEEKENKLEKEALEEEPTVEEDQEKQEDKGFFSKTVSKLKKKKITEDDFDKIWLDLEIFLLEINVAYEIVEKIERKLRSELMDNSFNRFQLSKAIREVLVKEVKEVLEDREGMFLDEIKRHKEEKEPLRILMLGVNGTGKTTSIAKIIKYLQNNNYSVVVAAADTFRAAAVEQLDEHCKNLGVKCITHKNGSDPAAVAYDAVDHAKAKGVDVVLIDTAGRMPNNANLMMELQKIKRVSNAQMALFIGDSIAGNDLIDQINLFDKGVNVDGVVLTKVDTDERPGSVVTTAYSISKPIYFLGTGQGYDDLVEFNAQHVAEQLFEVDDE